MAKNPDALEDLRSVERFRSLSDADLKKVAALGTSLHQPANWTLIAETTPADKAYVIIEGEVAIRRHGEQIATVGPGGVIGEVGIMEGRLRTASVVSVTELRVVHFTREDVVDLMATVPAFADALKATVEEHLSD